MKMTHGQVEMLSKIVGSLGNDKSPLLAYRVVVLGQAIDPIMEALTTARTPDPDYQEYSRKYTALCERHAVKDEQGMPIKRRVEVPAHAGWVDHYSLKDQELFDKEVLDLNKDHSDLLENETKRQQEVIMLLAEEVDVPCNVKLKPSMCEGLLSGNEMLFLIRLGIMEMDDNVVSSESSDSDASEEHPQA